jgi:imidazoleglycerol-phosphate dehydratase
MRIEKERKTRESIITVTVEDGARRNYEINTPLAFFNHMIETIAWRGGLNIDVNFKSTNYKLTHVITEDVGITLGRAMAELFQAKLKDGINMQGCGMAAIDEALSVCAVSVEGRSNCFVNLTNKKMPMKKVEDTLGYDLVAFLEGFAQGLNGTVNIKVLEGTDPHHLWESVFRSLGDAIKMALEENNYRQGLIAGVKGVLA